MPQFITDSGSFVNLQVTGSTIVSSSVTSSAQFSISGSNNSSVNVFDITSQNTVFQISSGSVNVFDVRPGQKIHISGTLSIAGTYPYNLKVSAGTTSNSISSLVLSNANNVDFGITGNTITLSTHYPARYRIMNPENNFVQAIGTWGSNSLFMQPFETPSINFDRVGIPFYISKPTNNNSNISITLSMQFGLYTRSGSTLNLMTDNSVVTSFQSTISNTNTSIYQGIRLWTIGLTNTLAQGEYYAAMLSNVTTGGQGTFSNVVISQQNSSFFGLFGQSHNQTIQYTRGLGFYSATTLGLPSSIALSELYGAVTNTSMTTGTIVLRQPAFYLMSQTF